MEKTIRVASNEVLRSVAFRKRFSEWLNRHPLISRREMLEMGTDVLHAHIAVGGTITTDNGEPIPLPPGVFDAVHAEDDGGWISEQRRNREPKRRYAKRLLPRLRLYFAISVISGCALTVERQQADVAEVRKLLGRFNRVTRARYIESVRRLRKAHEGKSALLYGTAIRQLRLRLEAELDHWEQNR